MEEKKTTQALKQIFDQCGTDVLQDRRRFESVLMDILPGDDRRTERMLIQSALNSDALTILLRSHSFTPDAAQRAAARLQKDCFFNTEAAEFVVRCVIAARGGDPNVLSVTMPEPPKPTPSASKPKPTPPAPKPEPMPSASKPEPHVPPEPPKPSEPHELATIYSRMPVPGRFFNRNPQGNLHMHQDRMLFLPNKGKGQVEISYEDVYMLKPQKTTVFWWTLLMILIPCVTLFFFTEYLGMDSAFMFLWIYITIVCLIVEFAVISSYRHNLVLTMDYAISSSGNRYRPIHRIHIFAPADKKLAVSIIKSKMNSQP